MKPQNLVRKLATEVGWHKVQAMPLFKQGWLPAPESFYQRCRWLIRSATHSTPIMLFCCVCGCIHENNDS